MEKNGKMLHTFIFNEKEGVRMSMYFDARINNGNNGSNDDTMFGKDLKTSLKTRFIVDRLINDNPIVVIRVVSCRCLLKR